MNNKQMKRLKYNLFFQKHFMVNSLDDQSNLFILEIFATMDEYILGSGHMFVIFAINLFLPAAIWLNTGNQYKVKWNSNFPHSALSNTEHPYIKKIIRGKVSFFVYYFRLGYNKCRYAPKGMSSAGINEIIFYIALYTYRTKYYG